MDARFLNNGGGGLVELLSDLVHHALLIDPPGVVLVVVRLVPAAQACVPALGTCRCIVASLSYWRVLALDSPDLDLPVAAVRVWVVGTHIGVPVRVDGRGETAIGALLVVALGEGVGGQDGLDFGGRFGLQGQVLAQ